MITDQNIGIEIKYNYLNLPREINWTADQRKIEFTYSASGAKLQNKVYDETGNSFEYEYAMKDHLGNTRLSFDENKYLYNGKELVDANVEWRISISI